MTYKQQFKVGSTYLTQEGELVKIIAENNSNGPGYRCVQGDDGEERIENGVVYPASTFGWRYDREGDIGRCTASARDNPRNLIPGTEVTPEVIAFGLFYMGKFFQSFDKRGAFQTASNARKQGIPEEVVLTALRLYHERKVK